MKLAFVKKNFSIYGGAERYLQTFLGGLQQSGHELHVFANRWQESPSVQFHRVRHTKIDSLVSVASFNANLQRALGRHNFDCVISFERTLGQDIYRAGEGCHSRWLKIRDGIEPGWKRAWLNISPFHRYMLALEKKIYQQTPVIVANSDMVRQQIIADYQIPAERIEVVYNGVDLQRFNPANRTPWRSKVRADLGIPEDQPLALFVGTGFLRKGLHLTLRAMAEPGLADLHLLVVGRGDKRECARELERTDVRQRVHFLGPQPEIEKFYAAADLFVLPTLYDPFSNATIEALAAGLPVITSRSNGVAELMTPGEEGYLLDDCFDATELADKLKLARDRSVRLGVNARMLAERYPLEHATAYFQQLVTRFLASRG